jgi:hypothetical protein
MGIFFGITDSFGVVVIDLSQKASLALGTKVNESSRPSSKTLRKTISGVPGLRTPQK